MDDENNQIYENDEGMFGGAELEKQQEVVKDVADTTFDMGANATRKVAGAGRKAISGVKNMASKKSDGENNGSEGNAESNSENSQNSNNSTLKKDGDRKKSESNKKEILTPKDRKRRIAGAKSIEKGKKLQKRGENRYNKGTSLIDAGNKAKKHAQKIRNAATTASAIPYIGSALSGALRLSAKGTENAGKQLEKSGKRMQKSGNTIINKGTHNIKRGKILSRTGKDVGDVSADDSNIPMPEKPSMPTPTSIVKRALRFSVSIFKLIMAIPFVKWILLGLVILIIFMAVFSTSSRENEGRYNEGDNSNVPYVVSNSIMRRINIQPDASGNLTYNFTDESGRQMDLDEAIDSALITLRDNDSSAYGDLGNTDEERKQFLKTLILAELATQYPDLDVSASGNIDLSNINENGNSVSSGTAVTTVTVDDMTLDEKIYQLLMVGVTLSDGNNYTNSKVGGFFFFGGSNYSNLDKMGSAYKVAPFVATDDEGGQITRIATGTPSAKSYGDSQNYDQLRSDEIEKSRLLLEKGVNLNLGPVTDVVSSGTIYDMERSYSSNPEIVRNCVKTVLEARSSVSYNNTHIGSSLKHYPGYPNADANSDFAVTTDNRTENEINASINNFKEGIRNGAQSVMVSNVVYSNIDNSYPASLSPTIVSQLRGSFNGVIMTDGIDATATSGYSDRYKQAIIAGNDMVLLNEENLSTAFNQIKSAVESGEISESRINESVNRVLTMKRNLGILRNTGLDSSSDDSTPQDNSSGSDDATTTGDNLRGNIVIKRKDNANNVATLSYIDEETFNNLISSGNSEVMRYYTLKKNTGGATSSSGPANYSGSDNEEIIWNYLRSRGLSEVATAGIIGNLRAESGLNTAAIEGGSAIGFGLAQWSFGRRTQIENYAASIGKSPSDIEVQLDFLWMETNPEASNSSSYANLQWGGGGYGWGNGEALYAQYTAITDVTEAATMFCWAHERPNEIYAHLDRRIQYAQEAYNAHAGSSVSNANSSSSASSANSNRASNNTSSSTSTNLNNFLFIGDSRYNGIRTNLEGLGNDISVCAVDNSNAAEWIATTQNKSGTVKSTQITLPATASGVSVMLGVNNTSQVNELKQVLENLHTNYPNAKIYFNSVYHVGHNYTYMDAATMNANIDALNEQLRSYCGSTSWLEYVDITSGLYDNNGYMINEDAEGLHLQGEGQTKLVQNIQAGITGGSASASSGSSSNVSNNSGSQYLLVVASYTSQNVRAVDSYQYSHSTMVSTSSGTSGPTTQHSATPADVLAEDYTTTSFTTTSLDYQEVLKDYTLYFDFLWSVYVSSRDKDAVLDLANRALSSEIDITLYTENNTTVSTSTAQMPQITRTQMEGTTAYVDYYNTTRTTTVTTQIVTSKACVTKANVWFLNYSNDAANYAEYNAKTNEVIEENTSDDSDLMKYWRRNNRVYTLSDSSYLVERMTKDNAKVSHLYDIYVYMLDKAKNSSSGDTSIQDIINVGSFDISTFVPTSRGTASGDGSLGGEEIVQSGDGYNNIFRVGTRTYINYKQMQGSWCGDSLAGFEHTNLSNSGCAINAIAVILSGYGINMTPGEVNSYAKSTPTPTSHGITLSALLGKNVTYHGSGNFREIILQQLNSGKPCLVRTSAYSSSHYICILAISTDGTQVYVSDVGGDYEGGRWAGQRDGWQPVSFLDRINMEVYTIDD